MKCPKCSYVSHDYLDACRKCSMNLVEFKQKFNLMVLQPGELDLGVLVDMDEEGLTDRDRFSPKNATPNTPHGESHRTNGLARKISMAKSPRVEAELDKMPADIEVDIQFDADNTTMTTEPGALTRTFYVPEELAKQTFNMPLPDRKAALDERPTELKADIQPETDHPALLAENRSDLGQTTPAASTIDLSLGKLENSFDNMPEVPQVDRQLNIDNPTPSTEPGELTKMFYVGVDEIPAAPQVDSQLDPGNPAPLASPESSAQCAQASPTNTLEISVGKLEGNFDEFEDIQLDTTEIDQDIDLAFNLPSTIESKSTVDYDAAETARTETTPGITSTSVSNEAPEVQEEPFAVSDDEFGLAREGTDYRPSRSEKRIASPEAGRISAPDIRTDRKKI